MQLFADQLPESIIKRLSLAVKAQNGINLGQGIPSFPTAAHILAATAEVLRDPAIGIYPNFLGTQGLRDAVITRLNHDHNLTLSANHDILITVGAMEATATTILSLINNGDKVGIVTPNYCNHFPQITLARGEIVEIPMREGATWELDMAAVKKVAPQLKLLLITNPSNPTGAVTNKSTLQQLVNLANRYGFWILADETYHFLTYDVPPISLLDLWAESDRLLTVRSFSKEYAMTGWRVGYLVANPEFISVAARTHDALVGCAPKISQKAAMAAISGPQMIVKEYQTILRQRRDRALKLVQSIPQLSVTAPQGAYYLFPKYAAQTDSQTISNQILERVRVGAVPGGAFGRAGEKHVRLSFAVEENIFAAGIDRLKQFFSK